eukprot:TRINITY_DN38837_c1_g1_i1.p1 TRINITY_DN38837_c1_g1~~TRINITY_DN38837_c1_g1_i1.p1  ORF type:complete len:800 (+),score=207.56 TRINITY_DN38837_c1_g1_i1:75-2402(+)
MAPGDSTGEPLAVVKEEGAGKKKRPRKKKSKDKAGKEEAIEEEEEGNGDGYAAPAPAASAADGGADWGYCGGGYGGDAAPLADGAAAIEDWVDITDICNAAASGMPVGEMIESQHFRLFDAMSAIEIMDPKMDTGFDSNKDMTLAKAIEIGIVVEKMPHEELVGIWDQLLMYYMLWLEGHTIAQTCFCCLYLQDLQRCVKPVAFFGAFVDALLLACRTARSAVWRAGVFDDEDFQPGLFSFDLEACVFSTSPSEIKRRIEQERAKLARDASPMAAEVSSRLQFMGQYAIALVELYDGAISGLGGDASTKQTAPAAPGQALELLTDCLRLLEGFKEAALPAPDRARRAFDASVNRRLLVPGPPRTVAPIEDPRAYFALWLSHVNELLLCGDLRKRSLVQLLDGSVTYKGEPSVLPRSLAHLRVSESGLLRRLLLDSLESFLFPLEAQQHCKKRVDAFLENCEAQFAHLLKLTHANRARRFRRLAHVFAEFNQLQHDAWQLDEELRQTFGANFKHPRPCWTWVMEHCSRAMLDKLFLGFELDLYDEAEYHMIYWYADYLFGLRIYNLNELYHAKEQDAQAGGSGKRRSQRPPASQQKAGQAPRNPPPVLLMLEATQQTVRALFRLVAFCLRRGFLAPPARAIEGLSQRFVLRFRSLERFRLPHLPSFQDFQSSAASAQSPRDNRIVLEAAQSSFQEASHFLDKFNAALARDPNGAEVAAREGITAESGRTLKRVIVANQLAIKVFTQALDGKKQAKATAAITHHPFLLSLQAQLLPS